MTTPVAPTQRKAVWHGAEWPEQQGVQIEDPEDPQTMARFQLRISGDPGSEIQGISLTFSCPSLIASNS